MAASSNTPTATANSGSATGGGDSRNTLRPIDAVIRVLRALWQRKNAAEIASRTGSSLRACEYWLARKTDMSADALAQLLRSDVGLDVLQAIIGEARPVWWRQFARTVEIGRHRKAIQDQRRLIEAQEERLKQYELQLD